jgi:uncharacterized protein (DUF1330 family)
MDAVPVSGFPSVRHPGVRAGGVAINGHGWHPCSVAAWVISEVEVLDNERAARYRELAQDSIARYGGRYVVREAMPAALEGSWPGARRLVIVEFPSLRRAREWYASPEYAMALAVRQDALARRLLLVESPE